MAVWWLPLFQLNARQVAADSHVSGYCPAIALLSRTTVFNGQPMNLGDRVLPQR